ncbi:hypothetical protein E2C01_049750 [Portunus trituberculatus]|uniref:Uncharacterized protein n=1 Tax=Portunus trituberculatus TaxID=210409 RepID=A0A5B7GE06_PORTR|nr:hypothetical protein [Portunus trituberculatus]
MNTWKKKYCVATLTNSVPHVLFPFPSCCASPLPAEREAENWKSDLNEKNAIRKLPTRPSPASPQHKPD